MSPPKALHVIRTAPILLGGLCVLSCLCVGSAGFLDSLTVGNTPVDPAQSATAGIGDSPASLVGGEPYLAAVFPDGAEIHLLEPQPDSAVATPWVDVIGTAPAETVLTLNDEIAVAGSDGLFSARIPLEIGLNEIVCIASDLEGNEVSFTILIAREPEEE
jgi:hypothetical protein